MPTNNPKPPFTWEKNESCLNTWMMLVSLQEIAIGFPKAGAVVMTKLASWNPAASAEARRVKAEALADQLDKMFRDPKSAAGAYQQNQNYGTAIPAMSAVLSNAGKTLTDLAECVDSIYTFPS